MTISASDTPILSLPETKSISEVDNTLSQIQSVETSYDSICNQALETIEDFLSNPDLDTTVREHLRMLLPKISQQKAKVLTVLSQAQDTLDIEDTDKDIMDTKTTAEYEQIINDFTTLTVELNQQLELLAKVVTSA